MDYYAVLGVARTATAKEVKNAYWQLMKDYHPDHANSSKKLKELDPSTAKVKFEEIQKAWNYFEQHIDFSKMSDSTDPIEDLIKENSLYPFEVPWGPNKVCKDCKAIIKESIAKYATKCPSCGRGYDNSQFRPDYGCDKGMLTLAAFTLKHGKDCVREYSKDSRYLGSFEKWDRSCGGNYSGGTSHARINFGGATVVIGTKHPEGINYAQISEDSYILREIHSDGTMDDPIEQMYSIVDPHYCIPLRRKKVRERLENMKAFFHFSNLENREDIIQEIVKNVCYPDFNRGHVSENVEDDLLEMARGVTTITSTELPATSEGSVREFAEFIYDLTTVGAIHWDRSDVFKGSEAAVVTADANHFRIIFSRIPDVQLIVTLSYSFRLSIHEKNGDDLVGVPIVDINSKFFSPLADEIKKQHTGS